MIFILGSFRLFLGLNSDFFMIKVTSYDTQKSFIWADFAALKALSTNNDDITLLLSGYDKQH